MRAQTQHHRKRPQNFTEKEKRNFCLQWEGSGQSKAAFSRSLGITKSAFYLWYNRFKEEKASYTANITFSPVALKDSSAVTSENAIQVEICLPNQAKLSISMQKSNVISFIQELCHATTVIR